jgi:HAD superfamily hydrolase (TIGR01509 family)
MNYIFDIGNVLINFKPKIFLHTLFDNPEDEARLYNIVFKGSEWIELDRGTLTPEEACARFLLKAPQDRMLIFKTMESLTEMLTPINGTVALLPEIKANGHKLFYLSNYHKELSRYIQTKNPFFDLFDGGVFSCDVHMTKPDLGIYRYFLDKFKLAPKDCLFFDDVEENIRSAESLGIQCVLYINEHTVKDYID